MLPSSFHRRFLPALPAPGAFTLIEVLVVVTIITILASLITAAAFSAIARAQQAAISAEIGQLSSALDLYKLKYGEYPPDCVVPRVVHTHLGTAFRYRDPVRDKLDRNGNGIEDFDEPKLIDPCESLCLWLSGFSPDPQRPLTGAGVREPLFDFDRVRLTDRDDDGYLEYVPPHGENVPYVYFESRGYEEFLRIYEPTGLRPLGTRGAAVPYGLTKEEFRCHETYQLISAGVDGTYGYANDDPNGVQCSSSREEEDPEGDNTYNILPYGRGEMDNLMNFTEGTTFESALRRWGEPLP